MLAYLKGQIIAIEENTVIVEVGDLGYEVFMPNTHGLSPFVIGETAKIFLFENIKEDAYDLYGFKYPLQKQLFKKLISVNGIGPKSALQILTMYSDEELVEIIYTQDSKALSKVSGIGPKTAQRVILELKDSIQQFQAIDLSYLKDGLPAEKIDNSSEAIEALLALGYVQKEATKAVKAISLEGDSTETLIKKALNLLLS